MKILLTTLEYPPFKGGVSNYYYNLVSHYSKDDEIFVLDNSNEKLVNLKYKPSWLVAFISIYKEIKTKNINHVIVGHILPIGTVVYLLSFIINFRYSLILHGMDFAYSQKSNRKRFLARLILKKAEYVFCGNSYTKNLVSNFLGNKFLNKISVNNPGIVLNQAAEIDSHELEDVFIKRHNLKGKFVLLSVGRLVERKGFDLVIDSVIELNNNNIVYVIIGDGPDKDRLLNKITDTQNIILFNEKINDKEKFTWYNLCDAFIMPSRNIDGDFEGFGIVYLEANLFSKPVIAGNSGGAGDAVIDGVNGLMVNPTSKSDIKNAILKLYNDNQYKIKLGKQGRERAMNDFNWDKQIKKISDKISSVSWHK